MALSIVSLFSRPDTCLGRRVDQFISYFKKPMDMNSVYKIFPSMERFGNELVLWFFRWFQSVLNHDQSGYSLRQCPEGYYEATATCRN